MEASSEALHIRGFDAVVAAVTIFNQAGRGSETPRAPPVGPIPVGKPGALVDFFRHFGACFPSFFFGEVAHVGIHGRDGGWGVKGVGVGGAGGVWGNRGGAAGMLAASN